MPHKVRFDKRHYEHLASIINDMPADRPLFRDEFAAMIALGLVGTNPAFSPHRFREAATKDD